MWLVAALTFVSGLITAVRMSETVERRAKDPHAMHPLSEPATSSEQDGADAFDDGCG
jgi:hypothetical protein